MIFILQFLRERSRRQVVALTGAIVLLVGVADAVTGYELSFSFFYLSAIAIAVWFVGARFALAIALASVVFELAGDLLAGAREKPLLATWNAALALGFYLVTIRILTALRMLQENLESKVRLRTEALNAEMRARELLEAEILSVSEREQRRIGHDLHDTLCQHLTATAIAGEVLREQLAARGDSGAPGAAQVVVLIEEGIAMARQTARGLAPIEMEPEGLMKALAELAAYPRGPQPPAGRFHCPAPVLVHDSNTATHLFRIAQEAVTNAARHARASEVIITLTEEAGATVRLSVQDNGAGLPALRQENRGMGIRIMRHRAQLIGAELQLRRLPAGTLVECLLHPRAGGLEERRRP